MVAPSVGRYNGRSWRLGQIRHHIPGPVLRLERGSAGSEPSSSQIGGKTGGSQNRDGSCVPRRRRLRAPAFEIPAFTSPPPLSEATVALLATFARSSALPPLPRCRP